jgi:ribosome-binding factor A
MESNRQIKFSKVLQKEISEILQKDGKEWVGGNMVTVTQIRVTPDFSIAKVYLSIFCVGNSKVQDVFNSIAANSKTIRYKLGASIKNQVRVVPELHFFIDDTQEYVSKMENIFQKISNEKNNKEH